MLQRYRYRSDARKTYVGFGCLFLCDRFSRFVYINCFVQPTFCERDSHVLLTAFANTKLTLYLPAAIIYLPNYSNLSESMWGRPAEICASFVVVRSRIPHTFLLHWEALKINVFSLLLGSCLVFDIRTVLCTHRVCFAQHRNIESTSDSIRKDIVAFLEHQKTTNLQYKWTFGAIVCIVRCMWSLCHSPVRANLWIKSSSNAYTCTWEAFLLPYRIHPERPFAVHTDIFILINIYFFHYLALCEYIDERRALRRPLTTLARVTKKKQTQKQMRKPNMFFINSFYILIKIVASYC